MTIAQHMASQSGTVAAAATVYRLPAPFCILPNTLTTESQQQLAIRQSGTYANFWYRINSNTVTATSTFTLRKNGANGNLTLSIAASTSGAFVDTTNSDSVSAGDLVAIQLAIGATGTSLNPLTTSMTFAADTDSYSTYLTSISTGTASSSFYSFAGVTNSTSTTEAPTKIRIRGTATLKNGFANVRANARTTNCTIKSRKNGADGNILVTITASTTGNFEDTTNTDSVSSGDDVNTVFVTSTGGGTCTTQYGLSISFVNMYPVFMMNTTGDGVATAATDYVPPAGQLGGTTATSGPITTYSQSLFSYLFSYVSTNPSTTGTCPINSYVAGAVGNQSVTVTTAGTGLFADTTNMDVLNNGESIALQRVNGTDATVTATSAGFHATVVNPLVYRPWQNLESGMSDQEGGTL